MKRHRNASKEFFYKISRDLTLNREWISERGLSIGMTCCESRLVLLKNFDQHLPLYDGCGSGKVYFDNDTRFSPTTTSERRRHLELLRLRYPLQLLK